MLIFTGAGAITLYANVYRKLNCQMQGRTCQQWFLKSQRHTLEEIKSANSEPNILQKKYL